MAEAWQEKGLNAGDREGWKEARGWIYGRGHKAYPVNTAGHFISVSTNSPPCCMWGVLFLSVTSLSLPELVFVLVFAFLGAGRPFMSKIEMTFLIVGLSVV